VADFLLVAVVLLEVLGKWVWVVGVLWMRMQWVQEVSVISVVLGAGDKLGRRLSVWKDLRLRSWLVGQLVLFLWIRVEKEGD
jgi:hypothetical protein